MIKGVLFDLDDTLYDSSVSHEAGQRAVFEILGEKDFEKFKERWRACKLEVHRELAGTASSHNKVLYFQRYVEKYHKDVKPSLILDMYDAYWGSYLDNMTLDEGVVEVFEELRKKGIKIGVVTNLTTHIQLRKLKRLGIEDYVDLLVTSEQAGAEKPRAIMFLLALNRLDVKASEVFMVGDSLVSDVEGGNAVGIKTVWLNRNNESLEGVEDYRKPDYVVKDIKGLLGLLDRV